ncbi:MAG: hypothetical protein A3G73_07515 [Rhodospirillales bacterium RIFCSPLOWO2_12_FULL_67_15]|nr:MAG: hypothetical protein A3G73_07515 [Rhodospirillales bacterium RIFCSPLOWO2_12_FULL_67_15]
MAAPPKAKPRPKPEPEPDEEGEAPPKRGLRLPDFRALGRKILGEKIGGKLFGPAHPAPSDDEEESDEPKKRGAKGAHDAEDEEGEEGVPKKKKGLGALWGGLDKRRKIAVAGAAAAVLLLALGGVTWWILKPTAKVEVARPRLEAGARLQSALAPPPAEEEAPAATKGKGKAKGGEAGGGGLNVLVAPQSVGAMLVGPAVNQDAFARIPDRPADPPLVPAPDTALVEQGAEGPLPKVGRDGRRAWQVYARPGPAADDTRPRIAIVVGRLGLNRPGGIESIRRLPGAVTLAFDSTAKSLADWVSRSRQSGHEVLFMLPVRSAKFPIVDEGPAALQASVPPADNIKRMEQTLMRGAGYVGVLTTPEGDIATQEQALRPIMEGLHKRGLMIVDGGGTPNTLVPRVATALGQPAAVVDVMIDAEPSRAAIEAKLAELETLARSGKAAVGLAQPLPVTLDRLVAWISTLEGKGIALVPVSAVAGRQVR